jgi:hypothetical protein
MPPRILTDINFPRETIMAAPADERLAGAFAHSDGKVQTVAVPN